MNNITFHVELDSYRKKDGSSNIQIRITQNRKLKRITIDISVKPEEWNPERSEVRKSNAQYRQINSLIKSKLLELERSYLESSIQNKGVSTKMLMDRLTREVAGAVFWSSLTLVY